jgi:hypothetical protein
MNEHLRRALVGTLLLTLLAGCGGGVPSEVLVGEPVLVAPPDGTDVGRWEREGQSGIFVGDVAGFVRVAYATPLGPEDLLAYYEEAHGPRYALRRTDDVGSFSGGDGALLTGSRGEVGVSIFVGSGARTSVGDAPAAALPLGTSSVVTIEVAGPP